MTRIETMVEIAAPAQEVFAFFVPQRMAYWYGREISARLEAQGGGAEFHAGQRVHVSGRLGEPSRKRELGHTACVTLCEWGRALEWRFEDPYGVTGLEHWELEASPSGGTRVRMITEYEMPNVLARLANLVVTKRALATRNREYLERLKRLVEKK